MRLLQRLKGFRCWKVNPYHVPCRRFMQFDFLGVYSDKQPYFGPIRDPSRHQLVADHNSGKAAVSRDKSETNHFC